MDTAALLDYLETIQVDKHILSGRRGVEENVKIKIIIPLLQALGWDVVRDMYFEPMGVDLVLTHEGTPQIIVETKSWNEAITNHLKQCLEYCLKLKTPWVIISSGRHTALYCALLNHEDLYDTEPIVEFLFDELTGDTGRKIIEKLSVLVGKDAFIHDREALHSIVRERLGDTKLEDAQAGFLKKAAGFKGTVKTAMLTEEKFFSLADNHPEEIRDALTLLYREMMRFPLVNKNIYIAYGSTSIGFGCHRKLKPRSRNIGLFGIMPGKAEIAYGLEGWRELGISDATYTQLVKYPRKAQSKEWAMSLVALLKTAMDEILEKQ